jgi:alpha-glucoside transport system permease protein
MLEVVKAIVVVLISLAALMGLIFGLYWLTSLLPKKWQESWRAWVFLFPAMIAMLAGLLIPAIRTIYSSFLDDDANSWVGFDNYVDIFTTTGTRLTVFNSIVWVFVGTLAVLVISLAVARYADGIKGERAAKSAIFIPGAVSLIGAGLIWTFIYAGPPFDNGLLNAISEQIPGLPASMGGNGDRLWLLERGFGDRGPLANPPDSAPGFNTFLLIVTFIWAQAGFAMVIFSAAIKGVPDSLIEAAKVDGATNRQVFYKVTLPYIRATVVTVATLTMIAGLKAFDIVAAMTGGRFGTSTIANEFYVTRFVQGRNGLGSALAVLILILVIPIVIMNRQAQKRAEEMMGA